MLFQSRNVGVLRIVSSQIKNTLFQLRLQGAHQALRHREGAVSNLGYQPFTGSRACLVRGAAHPMKGLTLFIQRFERTLIFQ